MNEVTKEERIRIRSLYYRSGSKAMLDYWLENEDLVCEKFPDLVKACAEYDRATHEFTSKLKELIRATIGS